MAATIKIKDITPKFLTFYERAQGADPEQRWALWQEDYQFAAVPPTEEGMKQARQMLDESWDRYPAALEIIRRGASGFTPDPQVALDAVCRLLGFDGSLAVNLLLFVGNFEENAFSFTMQGEPWVNVSVEGRLERREVMLPHEFAHVVHEHLSGDPGGYVCPIGVLMMKEGIAIHASLLLAPQRPFPEHIEFEAGWLQACQAREREILTGVRPHIGQMSADLMWRFTMGTGPAGLHREAYYAGYRVVAHLLEQGYSLAGLARLTQEEAVPVVRQAIDALK